MLNHRRVLIAIITVLVIAVLLFGSSGLAVIALAAAGMMTITDLNRQQAAENNNCLSSGVASLEAPPPGMYGSTLEAPPANTPVLPLEAPPVGMYDSTLKAPPNPFAPPLEVPPPAGMYSSTLEAALEGSYNGGNPSYKETMVLDIFNTVVYPDCKLESVGQNILPWIGPFTLDGFNYKYKLAFEFQGPRHYRHLPLITRSGAPLKVTTLTYEEKFEALNVHLFDLSKLEAKAICDNLLDTESCSYSKFRRQAFNDDAKKTLCMKNGVKLICIPYNAIVRLAAVMPRGFDIRNSIYWYIASRIYDAYADNLSEAPLSQYIINELEHNLGYWYLIPEPEVDYGEYKVGYLLSKVNKREPRFSLEKHPGSKDDNYKPRNDSNAQINLDLDINILQRPAQLPPAKRQYTSPQLNSAKRVQIDGKQARNDGKPARNNLPSQGQQNQGTPPQALGKINPTIPRVNSLVKTVDLINPPSEIVPLSAALSARDGNPGANNTVYNVPNKIVPSSATLSARDENLKSMNIPKIVYEPLTETASPSAAPLIQEGIQQRGSVFSRLAPSNNN